MKKQKNHDITKISKNENETFNVAKELALKISDPLLIGLQGELGSGKTIFAKGIAEGLNVKELITSPTFLGVNEYYSGKLPFIHMDFYKKVVPREIIRSYLTKGSVVLIEWIENFANVFKENLNLNISVYIQSLKDKEGNILNNERHIAIDFVDYKEF